MNNNSLKRMIYIFCIIVFTIYIIYRIFFTLALDFNIICFVVSLLLLLVELWDGFDFYVYFLNILIYRMF